MRKILIALTAVLALTCGVAAAETFTGPITTNSEGLGVNFREIQIDGKWMVIGCGPDSDLSEELLAYLDDHWDKTGSVTGEAVNDPHFGLCISNPGLPEQKADNAASPTPSKLAEYDWIKLPDGLTAEEREILETTLTGIFWDPVYQVPMKNFVGVCRYFHERGFTVEASIFFSEFKRPESDGTKGIHMVKLMVVNASEDIALKLMLGVVYNVPGLRKALPQEFRDTEAKSFVFMADLIQTDQYLRDEWQQITPADWFVILKSIIEKGYVEEG